MARPRSDIAPRIVHAARKRFLSEGVDGASLRAIARDAGTSIGMVYYYFPAKDDLFLAVVEEIYIALLAELESALARTQPVEERLRLLYQRLGTLTDDESQVVRLVLREVLVSPGRFERLMRRFQRGHIPLLLELVQDGVAAGLFRNDLPIGLLLVALGAIGGPAQILLGTLERHLGSKLVPRSQDRAGALIEVLLHGAGAQKSASQS